MIIWSSHRLCTQYVLRFLTDTRVTAGLELISPELQVTDQVAREDLV